MMFNTNKPKSISDLRQALIDDTYAMAFVADIPAALLEVPEIENMSDEEVLREAKNRGML